MTSKIGGALVLVVRRYQPGPHFQIIRFLWDRHSLSLSSTGGLFGNSSQSKVYLQLHNVKTHKIKIVTSFLTIIHLLNKRFGGPLAGGLAREMSKPAEITYDYTKIQQLCKEKNKKNCAV